MHTDINAGNSNNRWRVTTKRRQRVIFNNMQMWELAFITIKHRREKGLGIFHLLGERPASEHVYFSYSNDSPLVIARNRVLLFYTAAKSGDLDAGCSIFTCSSADLCNWRTQYVRDLFATPLILC
jgi:hypothetical protein